MKKIFALATILVVSFIIGGSSFNLDIVSDSDSLTKEILIACSRLEGGAERVRTENGSLDELKETASEMCRSYKIKVYSFLDTHKADNYTFLSKVPYYYSRHRILSALRELMAFNEKIENGSVLKPVASKNETDDSELVTVKTRSVKPVTALKKTPEIKENEKKEFSAETQVFASVNAEVPKNIADKIVVPEKLSNDKTETTNITKITDIAAPKKPVHPVKNETVSEEKNTFFSVRNETLKKEDSYFAAVIEPLSERPILGLSFASSVEEYTVDNKRKIIAYFTKKVPAVGPLGDIDNETAVRLLKYKGLYAAKNTNEALGAFCVSPQSNPDSFWNASYYPENYRTFTSSEKMGRSGINCSIASQGFGVTFRNTAALGTEACEISVDGSDVRYVLDEKTMTYSRIEGKTVTADVSVKQRLALSSVLFLYPPAVEENGEGYGNFTAVSAGRIIHGVWVKNSTSEFMQFFDRNGNTVELKTGLMWIQHIINERISCAEQIKNVIIAQEDPQKTVSGGE